MQLTNLTLTAGIVLDFSVIIQVDYLVVAGGGAGANHSGAGGGGLVYSSESLSRLAGQSYAITVGAVGGNSDVFGATAYAGAGSAGGVGGAGGSGSGGGRDGAGPFAGGVSTQISYVGLNGVGLGNSGGIGIGGAGGGGGGAGVAGANGTGNTGGAGGDGYQSSITGTAVYYAGGGGGGGASVTGAAGLGTGVGSYGGGSQGQGLQTATQGVVILRYADTSPAATTTGSPTITVAGGYRVYTFTGDGTITFN